MSFIVIFFFSTAKGSPNYQVTHNILTISGSGTITRDDVITRGSHKTIISAIIENGITIIEEAAFFESSNLENVTIPESINSIGGYAFKRCPKLIKFIVSPNNKLFSNDDQGALYKNNQSILIRAPMISNFEIPETVTTILNGCFSSSGTNLGDIVLPNKLTTLEYNSFNEGVFNSITFKSEPSLEIFVPNTAWYITCTRLMIPKSCITIDTVAFAYSTIKTIEFQEVSQLYELKSSSFAGITNLQSIELPDSLTIIGDSAFEACSSLKSVSIGKSCSTISETAFSRCTALASFSISEGNQNYSTYNGAIMDLQQTTFVFIPPGNSTISFPSTVTTVAETLLQSQKSLTTIDLSNNQNFDTEDGVLYSKGYQELIAICGGITNVSARTEVTKISNKAAQGCTNLVSFTFLSDTMCNAIGSYSFAQSGIQTFDVPNSITTIGAYAFYACKSIQEINISPDSELSTIGTYAFASSVIPKLYIPPKLSTLSQYVFHATKQLETIDTSNAKSLKTFDSYAFIQSGITEITIPSSLTNISESCFSDCTSLTSVTFLEDSQLKVIDTKAFNNCPFTSITLPSTVESLGTYVFSSCTQLTTINHSLKTIPAYTFEGCTSLTTFNVSISTQEIIANAFSKCTKLDSFTVENGNSNFMTLEGILYSSSQYQIVICPPARKSLYVPSNTTSMHSDSFSICTQLVKLSFMTCTQLSTFGENIFSNCAQLKDIYFPPGIKTIGAKCFKGCTSIKTIVLPPALESIKEEAFDSCSSLRTVIFCGITPVQGPESVFANCPHISFIQVTTEYNSSTFCQKEAIPKLTGNCVLKNAFYNTCEQNNVYLTTRHLSLFTFIILGSY